MNVIIKFEFKKFLRNKKNIIVIALFALCISAFLFLSNTLDNTLCDSEAVYVELRIDQHKKNISNLNIMLIENPDLYDSITESIKLCEEFIRIMRNMSAHIQNNERLLLLADKIEYNNLNIEHLKNPNIVSGVNIEELEEENIFLEYLAERKLEEINEQASIKADNAMVLILGDPAIIIAITTVLMCSDVMASEFDNKTSYVLFSQPIKKRKIFFGKFIAVTILITLFFALFFIFLYIVLTVIKGGLQFQYPYIYFNGGSGALTPAITVILLSFVLIYLLTIFIISLTFLVSSVFKTTVAVVSVTTLVTFLFYLMSSNGLLGKAEHLSPFSYLNVTSVINGEAAELFNNINVCFLNGVIVLIISILILLSAGIYIFEKNTGNI